MHVSEIETPALLVDLDVMERNLRRVADYTREHGLRLRPHTKTHKSTMLAKRQLALGAAGLTVAKVSEAEVMLGAEPEDILVAFPIVGRPKLDRLMHVARKARVTVSLDSGTVAQQLSEAACHAQVEVGVLTEVDAGLGRVGVAPDRAVALARAILTLPNLKFSGIAFYPGHIKDLGEGGRAAMAQLSELLRGLLADFRSAGIDFGIVSGGSTPTMFHSHEIDGLNEIRPGTYIFSDVNTVRSGVGTLDDCAAVVMATVVSTAKQGQMIIDGGSKTFSSDRVANSEVVTFGHVREAPDARFHKMNEEHGFIDITRAGRKFAVGDRVHIVPNHICVCVNLHERVYGLRGKTVEQIWEVDARGKLQ
jgi:D-serine deaminase-like pyridoxal phosphate-dependent protein